MAYERDVIVERDGTGAGTILGIILAVIFVLAIVWFFFLGGMGAANKAPADQQTPPAQQNPGGNPGGGPTY